MGGNDWDTPGSTVSRLCRTTDNATCADTNEKAVAELPHDKQWLSILFQSLLNGSWRKADFARFTFGLSAV
jgi:hypothetical protein